MSVDEVLEEYFRDKFGGERSDFYKRQVGKYHASATGKCIRQVYYKYTEEKKEQSSSWPHFHLGNILEREYENALKTVHGYDYIKNSIRIKHEFDDFEIVGETDPVLLDDNLEPKKIFEIKTTSNIDPRKDNGASKHHKFQVHPYMAALKVPCEIVYLQKNDLEVAKFDVEFDPEIFNEGIERIRELHNYLVDEEIPPPSPFAQWECKYCQFKKLCDKHVEEGHK